MRHDCRNSDDGMVTVMVLAVVVEEEEISLGSFVQHTLNCALMGLSVNDTGPVGLAARLLKHAYAP